MPKKVTVSRIATLGMVRVLALSGPNLVLSVIFSETLVVPFVLVGWYLWEPVGVKQ